MTAQILDGRLVAQSIREKVRTAVEQRVTQGKIPPGIAVVLVGKDPASEIYVANKQKACAQAGLISQLHPLPADTTQTALLDLINSLNNDPEIHGILVQLPLPKHLDADPILDQIAPEKDVDGFHPYNLGRLAQRRPLLRPCTPYGVIQLLEYYHINLVGRNATIIGASNIVGRPMALEFLLAKSTITVCHRFTSNLASHVASADIVVVAAGKRHIVDPTWLKPGCIVVDVGIHRLADGSVTGDIDFTRASQIASWITPVPGGVGPMTIASLLSNTLLAAQ